MFYLKLLYNVVIQYHCVRDQMQHLTWGEVDMRGLAVHSLWRLPEAPMSRMILGENANSDL